MPGRTSQTAQEAAMFSLLTDAFGVSPNVDFASEAGLARSSSTAGGVDPGGGRAYSRREAVGEGAC
jgi:hypothetical protein